MMSPRDQPSVGSLESEPPVARPTHPRMVMSSWCTVIDGCCCGANAMVTSTQAPMRNGVSPAKNLEVPFIVVPLHSRGRATTVPEQTGQRVDLYCGRSG